jgi:hypothetical protein
VDRTTPADSDLNATPQRVGRRWVWPSGYSAPVIAGGDGTERPTFPEDLSMLSVDELQNLADDAVTWAQANATADPTAENFAAMRELLAGHQRVAAEMASRPVEAAEPTPTLAELAATMVPVARPAVAAVVSASEPPASEGPAAAPGAGGFSQADLIAAVQTATSAAVTAALAAQSATQAEAITAAAGELQVPDLDLLAPTRVRDRVPPAPAPIQPTETIVASADIPGFSLGQALGGFDEIGRAMIAKRESIGHVAENSPGEKITVAQVMSNMPEERYLRSGQQAENARKIAEAGAGPAAITAAGGRCVPAMPYYGLMVQAGAMRPTRDALAGFRMDRMAVTVLQPPSISSPGTTTRTVADGATNTNTTVTSATAAFDNRDIKALISGTGIPAGAYIVAINSATSVTISVAATATATGVTLTIVRKGAVDIITQAQDAAALNGTAAQVIAGTKPCLHVDCPAPTTVDLDAITWCLEFGNWTSKAFPEQMPAWLQLTMAVWARTAETALLDKMSALSTQITATGIVGALRSLIGQQVKAAAYFRSRNRLPDEVTLRCHMPRWVIDLGVCDIVHGSGYDSAFIRQARQIVRDGLAEANVVPSYYVDSGTGKGQLFTAGGVQGGKHAAGALANFPSTVVWYLYPEGSFLFGDGGTLDFGIWRDSGLNAANNYRMMAENWETVVGVGYEMLEVTSTVVANGTFAGPAYGSTTVAAPVAIPATF